MMKSFGDFLKKYWPLILIEFAIVMFYVKVSPVSETSNLNIIISPEILATLLVGVAAVYSWTVNRYDREYEQNLQMLKDIDEINSYYDGKGDYSIKDSCRKHIQELEEKERYRNTFLNTYLLYIDEKLDNVSNVELPRIATMKTKYSKKYEIDKKYVRYSKNYTESAEKNNLEWATWYSLEENFFDISDPQKVIFLTIVGEKEVAFEITGKNLKQLKSTFPYRNSKKHKKVYDLYISGDEKGNYCETTTKNKLDGFKKTKTI